MKYIVDIDGTICTKTENTDYTFAEPHKFRIEHFNSLFELGNEIHYWTARGSNSKIDWSELTKKQLDSWGAKYTSLSFKKPSYDIWIDDKAINVENYFLTLSSNLQ